MTAIWPLSRANPPASNKKQKCGCFPGPMGLWCTWPRPQAESVVSTFVGDKSERLSPPGQDRKLMQCGLLAGANQPATKAKVRGVFQTRWVSGCMWSRPQAESAVKQICDKSHSQSAQRFCQKRKVLQTRRGAGFPDPMGTWCIWARPQAESVVGQIR